jgi:hypothetical protein
MSAKVPVNSNLGICSGEDDDMALA